MKARSMAYNFGEALAESVKCASKAVPRLDRYVGMKYLLFCLNLQRMLAVLKLLD